MKRLKSTPVQSTYLGEEVKVEEVNDHSKTEKEESTASADDEPPLPPPPPLPFSTLPHRTMSRRSSDKLQDIYLFATLSPTRQNRIIYEENLDDGTIHTHPLITDVKLTFQKRVWSDWKGATVSAVATFSLCLVLPENVLFALFAKRFLLAQFLAPLVCTLVMTSANYVEHVLSPPVEPVGITSFSGKSVFFTVNVIGFLLVYFALSTVTQIFLLLSISTPLITTLTTFTYALTPNAYALGTMLTLFYYLGVLTDPDEKINIYKWHRRGIPLARYLHTTHSSSMIMVNIDLLFKSGGNMCELLPEVNEVVVRAGSFGAVYVIWVLLNYGITGFFPYPFMNAIQRYKPVPQIIFLITICVIGCLISWLSWWGVKLAKCE